MWPPTLVFAAIGRTVRSHWSDGSDARRAQRRRGSWILAAQSRTSTSHRYEKREHTMSTDQNKTIARRIVDEAWTKHNPSILDTLFSSDAILHDPQNKTIVRGPQGAKSTLATYLKAFPDMKI